MTSSTHGGQDANWLPRLVLGVTTVVLVLFLAALDVLTGPEVSFSVFYLLPISLAAWRLGRWAGASMSFLCTAAWRTAEVLGGQSYSQPLIPYWNTLVRLGFFLVTASLLADLKGRLEWERDSARMDPLTRVANRRHLYELAEMQMARTDRYGEPFTLAYIDVDNFKVMNDHFGHARGDRLLSLAAGTIGSSLRAVDVVARLGGDEFAILLPNTDEGSAQEALRRVRSSLLDLVRENEWPVSFSMGIVTFYGAPPSVDEMVRVTDDLMYAAKQTGKGSMRYETYP